MPTSEEEMTAGVVLLPGLPQEMVFRPAEEVTAYLAQRREDMFRALDIASTDDLAESIDFHRVREKAVGDTVTIFRDRSRVYRMTFLEQETNDNYNVTASILHSKGHRIYGLAVVTAVDLTMETTLPCSIDDVLKVLYRRAWHTGIFRSNDPTSSPKEVEVDNSWNLRSGSQLMKKAVIRDPDKPRLQIRVDDGTYTFALLEMDSNVLIDLPLDAAE